MDGNTKRNFKKELSIIEALHPNGSVVSQYLETTMDNLVPDAFWSRPASSSGKYHPSSSCGHGGLIRHTKQVFWMAKFMIDSGVMNVRFPEAVLAACLLHDAWKYPYPHVPHTYKFHATKAVEELSRQSSSLIAIKEWFSIMLDCIKCHNGRFTNEWDGKKMNPECRVVHVADYLASRPCNVFEESRT